MTTTLKTPAGDVTHSITVEDVKRLWVEIQTRPGLSPVDAYKGLKAEVKASLNIACPHQPPEAVTDAHRIQSDIERKKDPYHTDAHHWLQKKHSMALWAETDRLVAAAGIVGGA